MDPMSLRAVLIEAFAAAPCQGNGAAVVLLDEPLADAAMQAIAGSLRQSETAFLLQHKGQWLLRWFTPTCEVPLCGHATLASLLALGHWGVLAPGSGLAFHSRSGPLEVALDPLQPGRGAIVLPAYPIHSASPSDQLSQQLAEVSGAPVERYWTSDLGYHVALLPPGSSLDGLDALATTLEGPARNGLVVMAAVDPGDPQAPALEGSKADYQLRFFAPGLGIPEDPVTGSAHALVAPYWLGATAAATVVGWQPSTRPGGMVCSAASSGMIRLLGSGHLLWDGTLHYAPSSTGGSARGESSNWAGWEALLPPG